MMTREAGVRATVQRQLGPARYETAWMMLTNSGELWSTWTRSATGRSGSEETWVGGTQAGLRGAKLKGRKAALVLVAVEKRGRARDESYGGDNGFQKRQR